jgi:hypothetical protein
VVRSDTELDNIFGNVELKDSGLFKGSIGMRLFSHCLAAPVGGACWPRADRTKLPLREFHGEDPRFVPCWRPSLTYGTMIPSERTSKGACMSITVKNTTPDTARLTLFGEMNDGTFKAKVMTETDVPYTPYWEQQVEQRMIYIEPDPGQLETILAALNERRLTIDQLQEFGSAGGGTSEIPV